MTSRTNEPSPTGHETARDSISPKPLVDLVARLRGLLEKATPGPNGCLEWTGYRTKAGYGQVYFGGRTMNAHRVVLGLVIGRPLAAGESACHRCDNPPCINPDHLFLGSQFDNMRDAAQKGRLSHEKPQSHRDALSSSVRRAIDESRLPVRHGAKIPSAKLSDEQVRAIRAATGSQREIARRFDIDQRQVSRIKNREAWAHVE